MTGLTFKLERRIRLPGQDWQDLRLEAECRHWLDMRVIVKRTEERYTMSHPVDCTGRPVQAEYVVSGKDAGVIKTFIVGV
jgi:hypothetical protein